MTANPFQQAEKVAERRAGQYAMDVAAVTERLGQHHVRCSILGFEGDSAILTPQVRATINGDFNVPSKGSLVLIAYVRGQLPVVMGVIYSENAPDVADTTRVVGHDGTTSRIRFTEDGDIHLEPEGEVFVGGKTIERDTGSPLTFPHTEWPSGMSDEEIWRINLDSDERLNVYRLDLSQKGGAVNSSVTIDLYDVDAGSVLVETSDAATGSGAIAQSGYGATVLARLTNGTTGSVIASVTASLAVETK